MFRDDIIKITQIRSAIGCLPNHKATVRALGLRKIGCIVYKKNIPEIRGMINLVAYMLKVEE